MHKKDGHDDDDDNLEHWYPPDLVQYGWGHSMAKDEKFSHSKDEISPVKNVIGSHRVHPMADHSHSNNNSTDESEKSATEIPETLVTKDEESNTRVNSALIVTFCESPHRYL